MKKRDDYRKNSITIPMSEELKTEIQQYAKSCEMTMSNFCRFVIQKYLKEEAQR